MEILNAILLLWAGIIIIFQVFFIKDLQQQIKNKNELIKGYREFFEYILGKLKEKEGKS